jgi:hypothetical protein
MTADAALVTLDFALRHRLLPPAEGARVATRAAALWVDTPSSDRDDRHGL